MSRTHNGSHISMPRAASMPPRSRMFSDSHPACSRSPRTTSFAAASSPAMNTSEGAASSPGVEHHVAVEGVERLHHEGVRQGALDLLAEAVVVDHRQPWREALREVEGVRDVDEDLAGQGVADVGEHRDARRTVRGVDDELGPRADRPRRCRSTRCHRPRRPRPAPSGCRLVRDPRRTSWPSRAKPVASAVPAEPVPRTAIRMVALLDARRTPVAVTNTGAGRPCFPGRRVSVGA